MRCLPADLLSSTINHFSPRKSVRMPPLLCKGANGCKPRYYWHSAGRMTKSRLFFREMACHRQYREMGDTSLIARRATCLFPHPASPQPPDRKAGGKISRRCRLKSHEKGPEYTSVFWAFEEGESADKPGSVPLAR